jgi:hypothetical protein
MAIASKSAGTSHAYPARAVGSSAGMPTNERFIPVPVQAVWDLTKGRNAESLMRLEEPALRVAA